MCPEWRCPLIRILFVALVLVSLSAVSVRFVAALSPIPNGQESGVKTELPYHDHPPAPPIPLTLDPSLYLDNRAAYVTYRLAAKFPTVLYQVPCYCPCHRVLHHESLLDCFTTKHGVHCPTCQKEVLFCFREAKKGRTPAEIRRALAEGGATKLDLDKNVDQFFAKLRKGQR